jgi:hypothetical protein
VWGRIPQHAIFVGPSFRGGLVVVYSYVALLSIGPMPSRVSRRRAASQSIGRAPPEETPHGGSNNSFGKDLS